MVTLREVINSNLQTLLLGNGCGRTPDRSAPAGPLGGSASPTPRSIGAMRPTRLPSSSADPQGTIGAGCLCCQTTSLPLPVRALPTAARASIGPPSAGKGGGESDAQATWASWGGA